VFCAKLLSLSCTRFIWSSGKITSMEVESFLLWAW
jgi:hypothetical protein